MSGPLILSIFPGIDLLGRALEEVWPEACVVRGPDLLWGGEIKTFHPPNGRFDGIIGGPPCQFASVGNRGPNRVIAAENLIPEFERCVLEAAPVWFLMENVPPAPVPHVSGYIVKDVLLQNRWLGEVQQRERRFSFGTHDGRELHVQLVALEAVDREYCVLASEHKGQTYPGARGRKRFLRGRPLSLRCELQGLPSDFSDGLPFTKEWKGIVIGNGVPLPMGRAVATAVRRAVER